MKVQFDSSVRIAGIGLVPWTRLGPERWFKNYKIASLYDWDLGHIAGTPEVYGLAKDQQQVPDLERLNTNHLLETADFQSMIMEHFAGYDFITYKPVDAPRKIKDAGHRFLGAEQRLTQQLENKAYFRRTFPDLPFPAYSIYSRAELKDDDTTLEKLLAGRNRVILQDEQVGGGRGTFVISDLHSLREALAALPAETAEVVVSQMIEGAHERSVQCVVTKYGVFVGHLQKQVIANPLLANIHTPGDRFCGGEISANDSLREVYPEIRTHALAIGGKLQEMGYRGIYSVDCLVDDQKQVFVLEINPRITGMTPLVTALYREGKDIPFYLLHLLEMANIDYSIEDESVSQDPPEGSMLVMHSLSEAKQYIAASPSSGAYDTDATYVAPKYRLDVDAQEPQLLIQRYTPVGCNVHAGGRLLTIFTNRPVTDEQDDLLPSTTAVINKLTNQIDLQEAI